MPKFTHKIEDLIESVAKNISYNTLEEDVVDINITESQISFPQMLDFTFPSNLPDEKIIQVGEVIYIGRY